MLPNWLTTVFLLAHDLHQATLSKNFRMVVIGICDAALQEMTCNPKNHSWFHFNQATPWCLSSKAGCLLPLPHAYCFPHFAWQFIAYSKFIFLVCMVQFSILNVLVAFTFVCQMFVPLWKRFARLEIGEKAHDEHVHHTAFIKGLWYVSL